jgi:hypothetical protein
LKNKFSPIQNQAAHEISISKINLFFFLSELKPFLREFILIIALEFAIERSESVVAKAC